MVWYTSHSTSKQQYDKTRAETKMNFSNKCLLFYSNGTQFCQWAVVVWMIHHEQMISGEEIHPLISYYCIIASIMASNMFDGYYL